MNQNNNQAQMQTQQLTPEELQKTQVLNLQELEETIRFEKRASKKPAIIVAIIGIVSIVAGSSFVAMQALSAPKATNQIQKKEVPATIDKKLTTSQLKCKKTSLNNPDGTDTDFQITYSFEKDKLTSFMKKFIMVPTAGNQQGTATVEFYKTAYQPFLNPTKGYQITLSPKNTTGLEVDVQVDFEKLDITTVNPIQANHFSTSIDYQKDADKKAIQTDMTTQGYICE